MHYFLCFKGCILQHFVQVMSFVYNEYSKTLFESIHTIIKSLTFVFGQTITLRNFLERVRVSAQIRNPAALSFADPRQIVYSHTFRQRKSMSVDYTAGSITRGRLTDRYEPANDNVCVNASVRCGILPHKAIFGNPSL